MAKRGFFVTGTDTGVGKTRVTLALMGWLKKLGVTVVGLKPVATGCFISGGALRNEDALLLQKNSSVRVAYEKINPYAFEPPVSPHIAARAAGRSIDLETIVRRYCELEQLADCVLVEGVGGWEVPLDERRKVSDLACALGLPVILVVGLRLGCLNHAFLTYAALARSGVECAGWIANQPCADFAFLQENLKTLQAELPVPYLGFVPYGDCEEAVCCGILASPRGYEILRQILV